MQQQDFEEFLDCQANAIAQTQTGVLPLNNFVDRIAPAFAKTYESYRLRAIALMDMGIIPFAWYSNASVPPKVKNQINLANQYCFDQRSNGTVILPVGKSGWQANINY